jgi:hypothetical protein
MSVDRTDAELQAEVGRIVQEIDPKWFAVVTIDRPYGGYV